MGCCSSKNKLSGKLARSEYRLTALSDLYKLKRQPQPLEPDDLEDHDFISAKTFHNLYYSGFYAPYICNPNYMLIIDCRSEHEYNRKHIMMSKWHGKPDLQAEFSSFHYHIVLYDEDSSNWEDASEKLKHTWEGLMERGLQSCCISGGFRTLEAKFPYMWSSKILTINTFRNKYLQWYPSLITDDLMMGRADQATNPNVVYDAHITHIVNLLDKDLRVFSHVTYLFSPLTDQIDQELLGSLPRIFKFITDALENGGRVLIHCDQGVNRAAAVVLAYLMTSYGCTLEDAYRYLESCRPTIEPALHFLKQLTNYEAEIFGRKLSNIDDIEF